MACNDALIAFFTPVPPDSLLEVWVEGDPDDFLAFGGLEINDGPMQPLQHSDLHPGRHGTRFSGGVREAAYTVNVQFTRVAAVSARVRAQVTAADGEILGEYCREFVGTHASTFGSSIAAAL